MSTPRIESELDIESILERVRNFGIAGVDEQTLKRLREGFELKACNSRQLSEKMTNIGELAYHLHSFAISKVRVLDDSMKVVVAELLDIKQQQQRLLEITEEVKRKLSESLPDPEPEEQKEVNLFFEKVNNKERFSKNALIHAAIARAPILLVDYGRGENTELKSFVQNLQSFNIVNFCSVVLVMSFDVLLFGGDMKDSALDAFASFLAFYKYELSRGATRKLSFVPFVSYCVALLPQYMTNSFLKGNKDEWKVLESTFSRRMLGEGMMERGRRFVLELEEMAREHPERVNTKISGEELMRKPWVRTEIFQSFNEEKKGKWMESAPAMIPASFLRKQEGEEEEEEGEGEGEEGEGEEENFVLKRERGFSSLNQEQTLEMVKTMLGDVLGENEWDLIRSTLKKINEETSTRITGRKRKKNN